MWVVLFASVALNVALPMHRYDDVVERSRQCMAQEQCVLAGGIRGCRCQVAVRANAQAQVDAAARRTTCAQVERLFCPALNNPRCEKRRCVADAADE